MNRRELLKSLPVVAALTPAALVKCSGPETCPDGDVKIADRYTLEEGPFYLFVVNPISCDLDTLVQSFTGTKIRGAFVVAQDSDVENYCRIYKLDE